MDRLKQLMGKVRGNRDVHATDMQYGTGSTPDMYDTSSTTDLYNVNRKVSLVHLTMEALPREDNYRSNISAVGRPSLGELHGELAHAKDVEKEVVAEHAGHTKLGWIQGVLLQVSLNIWGVMLFLRLSWVVGQSGILESLIVIAISTIVCVITALSLSAISTNGEVKGGGIYYLISRSLGPEFGGAIGIVFAFANAVAASMNTVGFCASLNDLLMKSGYKIIDNGDNDTRIVGVIALALMCVICVVGMDYEVIANDVLFVVISAAIVDFLVGAAIGPTSDEQRAKGFMGFSPKLFAENFPSDYRFSEGMDQSIITVFAIFFPSVTGVQAGANICGDLKDAGEAIPKGTLLAIAGTMTSYVVFVLFAAGAALRDASGELADFHAGNLTACATAAANYTCKYGLHNDYSVMQLLSVWGPWIYAGCFAATLSTAITNVLSVPKILEALGNDQIYPGLKFFAKGYFKSHECLRGYVLTYIISVAFLLIANLNAIAPLISNFYLASYGLINFCTFHAAHVKPLGWRPTWKYYNKWVSLFGAVICVVIMFLISWITSLITFIIIVALYMGVVYRKPDVNWGSTPQASTYKTALHSAHTLNHISEHVKNYHPQILVLSGNPRHRAPLCELAYLITKHNSLLVCGEISQKSLTNYEREMCIKKSYKYLADSKIKAFYTLIDGIGFEEGAKALMQSTGIGKLKPNVLMMGYKSDWQICPSHELISYFHSLHEAFDNRVAVTIVRLPNGINFGKYVEDDEEHNNMINGMINPAFSTSTLDVRKAPGLSYADSNLNLTKLDKPEEPEKPLHIKGISMFLPPESPDSIRHYNLDEKTGSLETPKEILKKKKKALASKKLKNESHIPPDVVENMTFFSRKHKKDLIDVWWLYDDGGLTILLPHIISIRKNWAGSKLRIFALTNRESEVDIERLNMAHLLAKFRIEYTSLTMVVGITEEPAAATTQYFNKIVEGFRETDQNVDKECMVTDSEFEELKGKTDRQLRLRELLKQHSRQAGLIIMSLPMPRKGEISAPMYMAWLEVMTGDMPPMLLVRGNHTSVLTFAA